MSQTKLKINVVHRNTAHAIAVNTAGRARTFTDRRKAQSKYACRGNNTRDLARQMAHEVAG